VGRNVTLDQARAASLLPHRQAVGLGAALAATGGGLVALLEPRPWLQSGFGWVGITGSVVCASSAATVPLRRWRQRRWARLAPRGAAPDWSVLVPRLRRVRQAGWVALVLTWLVAAAGVRSAAAVTERYERLSATGVEVPGEVTHVEYPERAVDLMRVAFLIEGQEHEVQIADIPDGFEVGDEVTMVVDPDDPAGATVQGVERSTFFDRAVQTFSVILSVILGLLGMLAIHRASIAGDALLATGLRPTDVWWSSVRAGYRLHRPGGRGRGIEIGEVMIRDRWLSTVEGPVLIAGPERGPWVLTDGAGVVGTVRRPLLPPWDLRRVLSTGDASSSNA
jgi:hypothetical protein